MVHPEVQQQHDEQAVAVGEALTPIYPSTEGMQQISWRGLMDQALALLDASADGLRDWVPEEIAEPLRLPSLAEALVYLHRPPPMRRCRRCWSAPIRCSSAWPSRRCWRTSWRCAGCAPVAATCRHRCSPGDAALRRRLLASLPFRLTGAQQRVCDEIAADLTSPLPMMRLLQGDVGSGKTVVGALAALQAVEAGYQVALMAPTELLSEQHLRSLRGWLEPLGLRSAGSPVATRAPSATPFWPASRAARRGWWSAPMPCSRTMSIRAAGLAIIDEQHRFGVHQRMRLREKGAGDGTGPHQLIMTATPIPRSLAMAVYADLDLSVIDELPPGRTPITTVAVPDSRAPRSSSACAQRLRRRAPGLLGLHPGGGVRGAAGAGRRGYRGGLAREPAGAAHRLGARTGQGRRARAGHGRLRRRRAGPAGGDHGDRGGRRRAQRQPDDHREPGAPWVSPSCTSCADASGAAPTRQAPAVQCRPTPVRWAHRIF
jgi:ATP-dependent DNA helicase RecG